MERTRHGQAFVGRDALRVPDAAAAPPGVWIDALHHEPHLLHRPTELLVYGTQTPLDTVIGEWAIVVNAFLPIPVRHPARGPSPARPPAPCGRIARHDCPRRPVRGFGASISAARSRPSRPFFSSISRGIGYIVAKWGDLRRFPSGWRRSRRSICRGCSLSPPSRLPAPPSSGCRSISSSSSATGSGAICSHPPTAADNLRHPDHAASEHGRRRSSSMRRGSFGREIAAWQGVMSIALLLAGAALPMHCRAVVSALAARRQ